MIHLGDITKLHGDAIPPVDCITGGSPCQDLSVAGKRAGLAGERSGLFMEQIRIVKEMRERDIRNGRTGVHVRPRFMVWENVPGAFSSNKGEDFRAVLEEIVKVVEADAPDVPLPGKGKWGKSGCLYDELGRWSVAWRVHDAQFWGVPQRRKRIALVADFGGLAAPEILFERKGMSGDPESCGTAREGAAATTGGCAYPSVARPLTQRYDGSPCIDRGPNIVVDMFAAGFSYGQSAKARSLGYEEELSPTLRGGEGGNQKPCVFDARGNGDGEPLCIEMTSTKNTIDRPAVYIPDVAHALSARHDGSPQPDKGNGANIVAVHQNASGEVRENDVAYTIGTNANASGRNTPLVYDARGNGDGEIAPTMTGDHQSCVTDYTAVCVDAVQTYSNQAIGLYVENDKASSLKQRDYKDATDLVVEQGESVGTLCAESYSGKLAHQDIVSGLFPVTSTAEPFTQSSFAQYERGVGTLRANGGDLGGGSETLATTNQTVRRLTPLECERLQGFPDGWTDIGDWVDSKGKKHKAADSPRYKALGNSIALPFWFWLLRRISAQYERPATLGSLFDGIGGFPLCWERCNGKGTAIWASEIEEFPIAVTKAHFPEVGAT